MKSKLSRDTITRITDIVLSSGGLGSRWNVNHEECPAGEDTRRRLYITVTDDNKMVLAHCFNCGGSAGFKDPSSVRRPIPETTVEPTTSGLSESLYTIDNNLYTCASPMLNEGDFTWPLHYFQGSAWPGFVRHNGFGIRCCAPWVVIPRGMEDGIVTGYDCRHLEKKKFTRNIHPEYNNQSRLLVYNTSLSDTAVVCEDPISAMKICLAGYAGVSLCGNSLSSDDAFKLSMLYDYIVMWMDNDSVSIKDLANQNLAKLRLFSDRVAINTLDVDPKHYTLEYIKTTVCVLKGTVNE